ncbi:hypothetical protein [Legionella cherrii]|nr:hypothetical protein [Legionella cherrii]
MALQSLVSLDNQTVLSKPSSSLDGLTRTEAPKRQTLSGFNEVTPLSSAY